MPVLTTDLTEEEADLLLATLDATRDAALFSEDAIGRLLQRLGPSMQDSPILDDIREHMQAKTGTERTNSGMRGKAEAERDIELKDGEHHDFIVIRGESAAQYATLCEALDLALPARRPNMPIMLGIKGNDLLRML